jgi:hypothetical protein
MNDFKAINGALSMRVIAFIVGAAASLATSVVMPPTASADDTALPSAQDKNQVIQEYYAAVSSQRYDEAYGLLTSGFYASASALQHTYREITSAAVDVVDIPSSAKAHVKVTLHWSNGETTSIYVGTITLAYDATAGRWLIGHRDLELVHGPPIDAPQNSLTLPAAIASGVVGYTLRGANTSRIMEISLRNKTDRVWELTIEEGLRLDPRGSSAQTMTVTKEIRLKLEPHEETTLELDVACLDISKPPPMKTDTSWTISENASLSNYVSCTNDLIDAIKEQDPANAANMERRRRSYLQFSLWAARGASESDWATFYHEWQGFSPSEATQIARELEPQLQVFVRECGSLTS